VGEIAERGSAIEDSILFPILSDLQSSIEEIVNIMSSLSMLIDFREETTKLLTIIRAVRLQLGDKTVTKDVPQSSNPLDKLPGWNPFGGFGRFGY